MVCLDEKESGNTVSTKFAVCGGFPIYTKRYKFLKLSFALKFLNSNIMILLYIIHSNFIQYIFFCSSHYFILFVYSIPWIEEEQEENEKKGKEGETSTKQKNKIISKFEFKFIKLFLFYMFLCSQINIFLFHFYDFVLLFPSFCVQLMMTMMVSWINYCRKKAVPFWVQEDRIF